MGPGLCSSVQPKRCTTGLGQDEGPVGKIMIHSER
jgi:hypothetical protein